MKTTRPEPDRLALTKAEAAGALGVGLDFFNAEVLPEIRVVRRGRRTLVPVVELVRWLDAKAEALTARDLTTGEAMGRLFPPEVVAAMRSEAETRSV